MRWGRRTVVGVVAVLVVLAVVPAPVGADPSLDPFTGDAPATDVSPVGDLDGDGGQDVVSVGRYPNATVVEGRRGTDGSRLWRRTFPATVDGGVAASIGAPRFEEALSSRVTIRSFRTGPIGADGVLVLEEISTVTGVPPALARLSVVTGDGTLAWTRTIPLPQRSTVDYTALEVATLDALPGAADDVALIVRSASVREQPILVLDGSDGSVGATSRLSAVNRATVHDVGDLDGDGLHDLGVAVASELPYLFALSAVNGRLWSTSLQSLAPTDVVVTGLGDVTGDGRPDIALDAIPYDYVVSGSGEVVGTYTRNGDPVGVPDLTGDGVRDISDRLGGSGTVTYRVRSAAGVVAYETDFEVGTSHFADGHDPGDVDGDGFADRGHVVGDEWTVVAGRTGLLLWSGPVGYGVGGSLGTGGGDDVAGVRRTVTEVVFTAYDGATGAVLWERTLPAPGATTTRRPVGLDADGDGTLDLLARYSTPREKTALEAVPVYRAGDPPVYHAASLRGGDGTTRWTL